jgi:hypothetical protein
MRTAGVLHDLRNQLTLASGVVERLRITGVGAEELGRILDTARELAALPLEGRGHLQPKTLVLRPWLLGESRAVARSSRRGGDAVVRVRCPLALRAFCEPTALSRLLRNLVSNALEASPVGSEVRIEARRLLSGGLELEVTDRGRGMTKAGLQRLFEAGAGDSGGTGWGGRVLGDALRDLDAELQLDSSLGGGTRARVLLPPVPRALAAGRVLLLDPDTERRRQRTQRLEQRSWEVIAVGSVERAAVRLAAGAHALVVARGTTGAGLEELSEICQREGVRWIQASAGDDAWLARVGSLSPTAGKSGSPAGTRD